MEIPTDALPEYPTRDLPPEYVSVYTDSFDILPRDAGAEVYELLPASASASSQSGPMLKCKLLTRANKSRIKPPIPTYFGGDLVRGVLEIRCDSSSSLNINSIVVRLRGQIVRQRISEDPSLGPVAFLDYYHPVWSTKDTPAGVNGGDKRFKGEHDIPFEFTFPSTVDLSIIIPASLKSKARESQYSEVLTFQTPQTSHQGHTMTLQYDLAVVLEHGLFKPKTKLKSLAIFVPEITPLPASPLRTQAYRHNTEPQSIPGPLVDLQGWTICQSVSTKGVWNGRTADVRYTIALANPLTYTRGGKIPLYLEVSLNSDDQTIIRALGDPEAQVVRLVQVIKSANNPIVPVVHRVKAISDAAKGKGRQGDSEDGAFYVEQTLISYANFVSAPKRPAGDRAAGSIATVQLAASETMALYGEIPITKELLPSSNFLLLNVEYSVEILPPSSPSLSFSDPELQGEPSSPSSQRRFSRRPSTRNESSPKILQSIPITIGTFWPQGPLPEIVHRQMIPPNASHTSRLPIGSKLNSKDRSRDMRYLYLSERPLY